MRRAGSGPQATGTPWLERALQHCMQALHEAWQPLPLTHTPCQPSAPDALCLPRMLCLLLPQVRIGSLQCGVPGQDVRHLVEAVSRFHHALQVMLVPACGSTGGRGCGRQVQRVGLRLQGWPGPGCKPPMVWRPPAAHFLPPAPSPFSLDEPLQLALHSLPLLCEPGPLRLQPGDFTLLLLAQPARTSRAPPKRCACCQMWGSQALLSKHPAGLAANVFCPCSALLRTAPPA